jgi:hypothetical protein
MGQSGLVLCNNPVEFHFAPEGEYNEYLPKVGIIIAVHEGDVVFENGTTWGPIQQSQWIYETIKDGNPRETSPIDLGEEGYCTIYNITIHDERHTKAVYAFRAKNVWVHFDFIEIGPMDMPYWGWMEDILRLQESRIPG